VLDVWGVFRFDATSDKFRFRDEQRDPLGQHSTEDHVRVESPKFFRQAITEATER
jgi:hypothetical protein